MTCAIFILLYVQYELSYDRFHKNADNIYRIAWMSLRPQTRTPHPMAQAMVRDFPEVVDAVSLSPIWGPGLTRPKLSVRYGEKRFDEPGFYAADSTFFKVFSFRLLQGDPETAMKITGGVIITEEIARKYFGDEEALGKTLILEVEQNFPLTVTGVLENIPANSHFRFDFLLSYVTLKPFEDGSYYEWEDFGHFNYLVLAPGTDPKIVEAKIPHWSRKFIDWSEGDFESLESGEIGFALQPITDIHLHSHLKWELEANSDISYVYLFSSAAFFILLIACINFMNLSTARSANRAKEVGVRKVIGASRLQLIKQFLGESALISIFAILIAIALVELLQPAFNSLTGRELNIDFAGDRSMVTGIFIITLIVAIISGSYPAFFISAFKPVNVLKSSFKTGVKNLFFRKVLVVVQFTISIALIVCTGIVASQLNFLRTQKLGFEKDQVVVVPLKASSMRANYEAVKSELLQNPSIVKTSAVSNVPGSRFNQNPIRWEPDNQNVSVSEIRVDYDFFKTLGIEIAKGRGFSREFSTDLEQSYILNETAANQFTWDAAIDKEIVWFDDDVTRRGIVIGVAKDFHFQSLHNTIEPLIFQVLPEDFAYMLVKISPENISTTIADLETKWTKFDPDHAFEYSFLDENFGKLYRSEEQMQSIFGYFTLLAIFIACLGLYGLVAFSAQQRIKEIGVRKVLGASAASIVKLLSKEYVTLALIANVIAWPVAYIIMNNWLQVFAYRTSIDLNIFLFAGATVFIVALFTVSYQAIKTAFSNPADALRYE